MGSSTSSGGSPNPFDFDRLGIPKKDQDWLTEQKVTVTVLSNMTKEEINSTFIGIFSSRPWINNLKEAIEERDRLRSTPRPTHPPSKTWEEMMNNHPQLREFKLEKIFSLYSNSSPPLRPAQMKGCQNFNDFKRFPYVVTMSLVQKLTLWHAITQEKRIIPEFDYEALRASPPRASPPRASAPPATAHPSSTKTMTTALGIPPKALASPAPSLPTPSAPDLSLLAPSLPTPSAPDLSDLAPSSASGPVTTPERVEEKNAPLIPVENLSVLLEKAYRNPKTAMDTFINRILELKPEDQAFLNLYQKIMKTNTPERKQFLSIKAKLFENYLSKVKREGISVADIFRETGHHTALGKLMDVHRDAKKQKTTKPTQTRLNFSEGGKIIKELRKLEAKNSAPKPILRR